MEAQKNKIHKVEQFNFFSSLPLLSWTSTKSKSRNSFKKALITANYKVPGRTHFLILGNDNDNNILLLSYIFSATKTEFKKKIVDTHLNFWATRLVDYNIENHPDKLKNQKREGLAWVPNRGSTHNENWTMGVAIRRVVPQLEAVLHKWVWSASNGLHVRR